MYTQSISDPLFFDYYNPMNSRRSVDVSRMFQFMRSCALDFTITGVYDGSTIYSEELANLQKHKYSSVIQLLNNYYGKVYFYYTLLRFQRMNDAQQKTIMLVQFHNYDQAVRHTYESSVRYEEYRINFISNPQLLLPFLVNP